MSSSDADYAPPNAIKKRSNTVLGPGAEGPKRKKARKSTVLHLANAGETYDKDIDADALVTFINGRVDAREHITKETLRTEWVRSVRQGFDVNFRQFGADHLAAIGVRRGRLVIRDGATAGLKERGDKVLQSQQCKASRDLVRKYVYQTKEAGARLTIDTIILPAMDAAQVVQDDTPVSLGVQGIMRVLWQGQFVLLPEQQIDTTAIGYSNGTNEEACVHGVLDYAITIVPLPDAISMREGEPLNILTESIVAVIEAKSASAYAKGEYQVTSQCLALRKRTGRTVFPALLTTGVLWSFYVAHYLDDEVVVYATKSYDINVDGGIIVALLMEVLLNPNAIPPSLRRVTNGGFEKPEQ
ncbi:hypothetical protein RQP46_011500 [Phenoliferia psychrophenolica]